MTLRTKVFAVLLTVFATYGILEYAVQRWVVYPRFLELERAEAGKNLERAVQALQRELDVLVPSVNDWGLWDDTYRYVQDRNPEYEKANLNVAALQGLAVNVLAFYDREGGLVWSGALDLTNGDSLELPKLISAQLPETHFIMQRFSAGEPVASIVQTREGPFLLVSRPVLTSEGEGPPMGSVLMARILDSAAITRLGAQARVEMQVAPASQDITPETDGSASGSIPHSAIDLVEGPAATVAETTMMDIKGNPALTLKVSTPRAISARGKETLGFATLSLGLAGALVLVIVLVTMRRLVLDPLSRLTAHASAVGVGGGGGNSELDLARKDEIGVLARAFDDMLVRLADARQRLLEQSYRSGVAENASGVLHNLGNAITPVGVKLGSLREALRQAPVEEIDLAAAELADPAMDPQRRADMLAFLELAAKELGSLTRRTAEDLDAISTQVDHVQLILVDQQRFSRAEVVLEPVAVAGLLEETIGLLPEPIRNAVAVEIRAGLKQVPPVRAVRVALQQVLTNVLINAAEAADPQGERPQPVRVRIDAEEDRHNGAPMLHLRFTDDGAGIPAENLPRIFERGFSTKSRGSGMGLHWCANTIIALGGRIFAESDGPGRGTCVHIEIPMAVQQQAPLEQAA